MVVPDGEIKEGDMMKKIVIEKMDGLRVICAVRWSKTDQNDFQKFHKMKFEDATIQLIMHELTKAVGAIGLDNVRSIIFQPTLDADKTIGPTGKFPDGKLGKSDEGELTFAIGYDTKSKNLIIDFGKPVAWLSMPLQQATEFADMIINKVHEAGG